ncbi:MAG TPA: type II toxin-antitoxin system HicB family antitoxin [Sphingomicrobium sp.]|nr:type II toxin-antitoxin system HicB family antitoxin [Sphingomicrobium sp.]
MNYPVNLTSDDNGTILVRFPDIPEAITFGIDRTEALENAGDALVIAIGEYIQGRRDVPQPSAANHRPTVSLNLLGELKLAIYRAMRARKWRKADLARALQVNPRIVDRLLDLRHASTVPQLEAALEACGRRAEIETRALETA